MHLVVSNFICSLNEKGGLGIRKMMDMNIALVSRWLWWLGSDEEGLWKRVRNMVSVMYGS